jgi:hypothetical protein
LLIVAVSTDAVDLVAAVEGPAASVDELADATLIACGLIEAVSIGDGVVAKAWFNEIGVSMVFHAPQSFVDRIDETYSFVANDSSQRDSETHID